VESQAARGWRLRRNPALDGYRAVAVVLVLLVHAWSSPVPGGTVGVYMFFGLSGFLITGLLLTEITQTQTVSFVNFYARRALRLLPAIVAVAMVVYLVSLYARVDSPTLPVAIPAALFYYANWARSAGNDLGMLQHTWSLSVEEQFYLIWPVIFWGAYRIWKARGALVAALLGALTSMWSMWWLFDHESIGARRFNGFDTNAVVLFMGCALAVALHLGLRLPRVVTWCTGLTGAAFILLVAVDGSVRAWSENSYYGLTLIALAGAGVLLFLDGCPNSLVGRALSSRPIAYVGRISYGIYLWHYPIAVLVAWKGLVTLDSFPAFVLVTALTLPVAAASYRFLESPFLLLQRYFRTTSTPDLAVPAGRTPGPTTTAAVS
jgi:peptidoglycan/LPS O-acetylase OafA/YrhL